MTSSDSYSRILDVFLRITKDEQGFKYNYSIRNNTKYPVASFRIGMEKGCSGDSTIPGRDLFNFDYDTDEFNPSNIFVPNGWRYKIDAHQDLRSEVRFSSIGPENRIYSNQSRMNFSIVSKSQIPQLERIKFCVYRHSDTPGTMLENYKLSGLILLDSIPPSLEISLVNPKKVYKSIDDIVFDIDVKDDLDDFPEVSLVSLELMESKKHSKFKKILDKKLLLSKKPGKEEFHLERWKKWFDKRLTKSWSEIKLTFEARDLAGNVTILEKVVGRKINDPSQNLVNSVMDKNIELKLAEEVY